MLAYWLTSANARWLWQYPQRGYRELLAAVGLCMIFYAIFRFDATVPFPSRFTLVPVIGTGLVLATASPETITGRLLANPAFVGIGTISYSLYLWHQPLFAFARIRSFEEPSQTVMLAMSLLASVLAWFSWRFVEQPFRDRKKISRQTIFSSAAACTAICIALGLAGIFTNGFGGRTLEDGTTYKALSDALRPNPGLGERGEKCSNAFTLSKECRTDDNPEYIVWGDSYAMHHVSGLLETVPGAKLVQMTLNSCGPLLGIAPYNGAPVSSLNCIEFNDQVMDYVSTTKSLKYAVLSSNFNQYTSETEEYLSKTGPIPRNLDVARAALRNSLDALIARGIKPILIWPTPEAPENIGSLYGKRQLFGQLNGTYEFSRAEADRKQAMITELLTPLKSKYTAIDLRDLLCDEGVCNPVKGKTLLYVDNGHLTYAGSKIVAEKINYRKTTLGRLGTSLSALLKPAS
jgi:hypothetical protein